MTVPLIEMLAWLQDAGGRDPDVKQLVRLTMVALKVESLTDWAEEEPEMIADLYEAARSLVDQAPLDETVSFTSGRKDRDSPVDSEAT